MALVAPNSVWFNVTSSGAGDFVVASALAGYRTPATAGIANGSTVHYSARTATEFENGEGVYTTGTVTLSRVTIFASSNANAKVTFGSIPTVAIGPIGEDQVFPPASSVDNGIALWSGTAGDVLKDSGVTLASSVFTSGSATLSLFDLRGAPNNFILNGGMEVDQERAGTAKTAITAATTYILDMTMWKMVGAGIFTSQQVADAPAGLKNSIKITVTTADASMAVTDAYYFALPIEGRRLTRLGFGAAGASSIALGFWVKANRTGTYSGAIQNAALNRSYPFNFTINVSGTWEYKTVVIPGDTTGTWVTGAALSMLVTFVMAAGTTPLGTANAWAAVNAIGVTGTINGVAATSDYMNITGVTLVPGSVAVPQALVPMFLYPFNEMQLLCMRYWEKSYNYDDVLGTVTETGASGIKIDGMPVSTHPMTLYVNYAIAKRSNAAVTAYSTGTGTSGQIRDWALSTDIAATINNAAESGFNADCTSPSDNTVDINFHWAADARL